MYEKYKAKADFLWVYIREAHPTGSRRPAKHVEIEQPADFARRLEVATTCCTELKLTLPQLVDDMQDTVAKAYNAMPDRLFVLAADGTVAYRGDRGPRGFDVPGMEQFLAKHLAPK